MDFSEFETARGGIWRICAVIDYATSTAWSVLALLAVVVTSTAAPAAATAA